MRISQLTSIIKIEQLFYFLMMVSIAFFLFSGPISRNAFYLLTYVSIAITAWLVWRQDRKIIFY